MTMIATEPPALLPGPAPGRGRRRMGWAAIVGLIVWLLVSQRAELGAAGAAVAAGSPVWLGAAAMVGLLSIVNLAGLQSQTQGMLEVRRPFRRTIQLTAGAHALDLATKSGGMAGALRFGSDASGHGQSAQCAAAGCLLAELCTHLGFTSMLAVVVPLAWHRPPAERHRPHRCGGVRRRHLRPRAPRRRGRPIGPHARPSVGDPSARPQPLRSSSSGRSRRGPERRGRGRAAARHRRRPRRPVRASTSRRARNRVARARCPARRHCVRHGRRPPHRRGGARDLLPHHHVRDRRVPPRRHRLRRDLDGCDVHTFGVDAAHTVAVVALYRLFDLWLPLVVGAVALRVGRSGIVRTDMATARR